jgi:flagellar L-ring protein FlgH
MRRLTAHLPLLLPLSLAIALTGCWNSPNEFMREPIFSPVGAGLLSDETAAIQAPHALVPQPPPAGPPPSLYTVQHVAHVGDIVTVIISINDKATLGNSTGRSQSTKDGLTIDYGYNNGSSSSSSNQPAKILGDLTSTSNTQGQGNIDRSEQIQVSVAAVVTRVLANGNLVISGSQEVRVNYELRQLTVAGIVHPSDVSINNTIAYDHIAEARISYGGRGRESDFQQPSWGQQIYDAVRPF